MNPIVHTENAMKKFGGTTPEDFDKLLAIHKKMDCSKAYFSDNRHRALTHTMFWVNEVMLPLFGDYIVMSNTKKVSVKDICEQHILEDFRMKFIPTTQDFLQEIEIKEWMENGKGVPESAKKLYPELNKDQVTVSEMLPYDKDWDLIFEVIEKIESLNYHVTIAKRQCQIYNKNWQMEIDADFYDSFIENTYDAITAFANWYSQRPASWAQDYSLPSKTEDKKDEVMQSLMEDLFHMDDVEADKIKKQYMKKYYFIKEDDIKNL